MSSLQREALKKNLPPLPNQYGSGTQSRFAGLVPRRKSKDYTSTKWDQYFDKKEDVYIGENIFRLYLCGTSGPVVVALHGGGHSALSWALFSKSISSLCECIVVAIDFRGHGDTETNDDYNMSADVLSRDIADVLVKYFKDLPPMILLGHSMGGAIAVHIAVKNLLPTLKGLAVIDVVEGTALDALSSMQSFLRSRPTQFQSIENAIEWSIRSGQLRNLESAKVSMIGQLKKVPKSTLATSAYLEKPSKVFREEEEEDVYDHGKEGQSHAEDQQTISVTYTWKVDLTKTEIFWRGWFENMTELFLSAPVAKLLILAGVDRLDKNMTIAQMQGKFQMQILANCGHAVHEDAPDKVAEVVAGFLLRQRLIGKTETFKRHTPAC